MARRRALLAVVICLDLALTGLVVPPEEPCTTDLHCAEMFGVDLYGNPYPPKEN